MRVRLTAFAALLGAFTASFYAGSESQVGPDEAAEFVEEFNALVSGIDALGIFAHNATLALPMFIPGFGLAWGLFSAWATGYAFAAISSAVPDLAGVSPLAVLYLSPFGLMELTAYSLALSRSLLLAAALIRRAPIAPQVRPAAAEVGVLLALLLAGGYVEFYLLDLASGGGVPTIPAP